ncbi:hypothetical protein [Streptomyces lannensis]|uniref:Uncharacterized protein n=1 Tax=Streptomyces lannensis TaxID=766498 RepID=A0ABP7LR92_9ACTN
MNGFGLREGDAWRDVDRLIRNAYKVLLTRGSAPLCTPPTPNNENKLRELVGGRMEQGPAGAGRTAAVLHRSAAFDQTGQPAVSPVATAEGCSEHSVQQSEPFSWV